MRHSMGTKSRINFWISTDFDVRCRYTNIHISCRW